MSRIQWGTLAFGITALSVSTGFILIEPAKEATRVEIEISDAAGTSKTGKPGIAAGGTITIQTVGTLVAVLTFRPTGAVIAAGTRFSDIDVECATIPVHDGSTGSTDTTLAAFTSNTANGTISPGATITATGNPRSRGRRIL